MGLSGRTDLLAAKNGPQVHMPVPKWGPGKHLYIAFHDGVVATDDGIMFPYPPDQGIRIIRPPAASN